MHYMHETDANYSLDACFGVGYFADLRGVRRRRFHRKVRFMLESYRQHVAERAAQGVPPQPLIARQVKELCELLVHPVQGEESFLLELLSDRVPPGVDAASKVKAEFLAAVANGTLKSPVIASQSAVAIALPHVTHRHLARVRHGA